MITRMNPDDVSRWWDLIKVGFKLVAPRWIKYNEGAFTSVLQAVLSGSLTCWAIWEQGDEGRIVYGFMLTYIGEDVGTKERQLNIYGLCFLRNINGAHFGELMKGLGAVANKCRCTAITGQTDIPMILEAAQNAGADTSHKLIRLEV